MKRIFSSVLALTAAALSLAACPIYSGAVSTKACPGGSYISSGGQNVCVTSCNRPSDCRTDETCSSNGTCELGDCTQWGCVNPYVCTLANGAVSCAMGIVPPSDGGIDSGSDAAPDQDVGLDATMDVSMVDAAGDTAPDAATDALSE